MIQLRSILQSADNTGARRLMCIHVGRGYKRHTASLGDIVTCVIKAAVPYGMVKKSEIVPVVLVRCRKEVRRKDGSYIRFDENAGVIVDRKTKDPKGTRIFGPIPRELKEQGFTKIISLAAEVV